MNQFYISAGIPPIDNSSGATSNNFYISAGLVADDSTINTFPTDWGRRCALVIQSSEVSATCSGFPVLVTEDNLPSEMFDADGSYPAISGGGDIRFSSDEAGETQLACEIEEFTTDNNPANGTAAIWVNVSTVSSGTDTTIYVWYNKSGESQPGRYNLFGKEEVWDSNFKMVQHMHQDPSDSAPQMIDSTSNNNDGTSNGAMLTEDQVAGKIGGSLDFDGTNNYINWGDVGSIDHTDFTYSIWLKLDSITTDIDFFSRGEHAIDKPVLIWFDKEISSYADVGSGNTNSISVLIYDGTTQIWVGGTNNLITSTTAFYYITVTFDNTSNSLKLYVNGNLNESYTKTMNGSDTTASSLYLGEPFKLNGIADEVRISDTDRSAGWIETEYNNQNTPSTFIIEGTPESPGEAAGFTGKINGISVFNITKINGISITNIGKIDGISFE